MSIMEFVVKYTVIIGTVCIVFCIASFYLLPRLNTHLGLCLLLAFHIPIIPLNSAPRCAANARFSGELIAVTSLPA